MLIVEAVFRKIFIQLQPQYSHLSEVCNQVYDGDQRAQNAAALDWWLDSDVVVSVVSGCVENSPKCPQVMSGRWVTGSSWQALSWCGHQCLLSVFLRSRAEDGQRASGSRGGKFPNFTSLSVLTQSQAEWEREEEHAPLYCRWGTAKGNNIPDKTNTHTNTHTAHASLQKRMRQTNVNACWKKLRSTCRSSTLCQTSSA